MQREDGGFSLVEMMLALTITLIVSAGVLEVVRRAHNEAVAQPESSDLLQRLRIASDAIAADLSLAGAPAAGESVRAFSHSIPAVLPFRVGPLQPDPSGTFKPDTLTVIYAPPDGWQTTLAGVLTPGASSAAVSAVAGCRLNGAVRDPACGFMPGMQALVFDDTGAYDEVMVTGVTGNTLVFERPGGGTSHLFQAGSGIVPIRRITYYLKAATAQVMRYNGIESDAPAVDNVASLEFAYFAVAAGGAGGLVPLTAAELTNGPWRPDAADANRYDADLLRIRRVAVRLHLRPGAPATTVTDREISFDVAPRNLAGGP